MKKLFQTLGRLLKSTSEPQPDAQLRFRRVRDLSLSDLQAIASEDGIDVGWGPEFSFSIRSIADLRVVANSSGTLSAVRWFNTEKTTSSSVEGCREMLAWLTRQERHERWPWHVIDTCAFKLRSWRLRAKQRLSMPQQR